jgi:hypothetical protein
MKASQIIRIVLCIVFAGVIIGPVFASPSLSMDQRIEAVQADYSVYDKARYEQPGSTIIELGMPVRPIICVRPIVDIIPRVRVEPKIGKSKRARDN